MRAADGPNHPSVADALAQQALFLFDADRTEECARYEQLGMTARVAEIAGVIATLR